MTTPTTYNDFGDYSEEDISGIATHLVERIALLNDSNLQPGEAAGFSEELFDAVYTLGVRYFSNQQYDKAHEMFRMLCLLQPLNVRNFKAWGANFLGRQDYESAIRAYTSAYMLSATDADTSFYLGQAHYFLKQDDEARGHLAFAREMARRSPALWPGIEAWSTQLLERIEARGAA